MTTSSTNNSVFRGFFEKQKLTGPNFIDWYRQLRIVLSIEDKLNYLEQPIPPIHVAPAGQQVAPEILAAHSAWVKGTKEITGLMLMTIEPEIQQNLEPLHAHEMLKEQEEGQSMSSYVLKMKGYIDNLERLGYPVTLGLGVSLILIGLRKGYDGFVQNYNMHNMGKTVNELHAMLKLHEQTLPKSNAPALNTIRAGKVQKDRTLEEELSLVSSQVNEEEEEEHSFWSWWFRDIWDLKLKKGSSEENQEKRFDRNKTGIKREREAFDLFTRILRDNKVKWMNEIKEHQGRLLSFNGILY
nr:zinc finger, CCHC-type [Tanacetum cinerariifolium]